MPKNITYKPFFFSPVKILTVNLGLDELNAKNVPLPLTEFIKYGYFFCKFSKPVLKVLPVLFTWSRRFSFLITFKIVSRRKIFPGSPSQVLKILYGCLGLKTTKC